MYNFFPKFICFSYGAAMIEATPGEHNTECFGVVISATKFIKARWAPEFCADNNEGAIQHIVCFEVQC